MLHSLSIAILTLAGSPQSIEPIAVMGEVGSSLRIKVWDAAREPLPGIEVVMLAQGGTRTTIGATDARGLVEFVPASVGRHRFVAIVDGVELIVPLTVIESRTPFGWFLIALPLAALSVWRSLRSGRRATIAQVG